MSELLHYLAAALGVWIAAFAVLAGREASPALWLTIVGLGVVVALLAFLGGRRSRSGGGIWADRLGVGVALVLVVVAIYPCEGGLRWSTLLAGLLVALILAAILRLRPAARTFTLHAHDGGTLMEVTKLEVLGSDFVMRGKMMGAMPTTAHLRPEELWLALTMLPLGVILRLPFLLYRAWRSAPRPSTGSGDAAQRAASH